MVKSKKIRTTWVQTRWSKRIRALREKKEENIGEYIEAPTLLTFLRPGCREKKVKNVVSSDNWMVGNKFASLIRDAADAAEPTRGVNTG